MNDKLYITLQRDFIRIRHFSSKDCYDEELFNQTIESIKNARKNISKASHFEEKNLFLYCIDTLFEIINENNESKTFDFADTIHNIPEICLGKRDIYSFYKEITTFQRKYGKNYFHDFEIIKPKFQKKMPKNARKYFSPDSDAGFKYLHPLGCKILCIIGVAVLLIPMLVYLAYTIFINPSPNEWPLALGALGAFIFGVGLFNIVAAWIHQHLGHLLTIICILSGGLLTALSLFLLYK